MTKTRRSCRSCRHLDTSAKDPARAGAGNCTVQGIPIADRAAGVVLCLAWQPLPSAEPTETPRHSPPRRPSA